MNTLNIFKSEKGYTLVELLAVISILVVLSGIITGILYSTLRGSNKVKITTEVSQNGTYTLSLIGRTISDSRDITKINGVAITDCTQDPGISPAGKSITLKRLDGSITEFKCTLGNDILADNVSIINTDQILSDYTECSFSCSQKTDDLYAVPIIKIKFKLTDKNAAAAESRASASFETSYSLRNYLP